MPNVQEKSDQKSIDNLSTRKQNRRKPREPRRELSTISNSSEECAYIYDPYDKVRNERLYGGLEPIYSSKILNPNHCSRKWLFLTTLV